MITIRTATQNDIDRVTQWVLSLHQHESIQSPKLHDGFSENMQQWIKQVIHDDNSLCLIATLKKEDNSLLECGCLIGNIHISAAGLLENPLRGQIQVLWIEPDFRKKNIAHQLIQAFTETVKLSGAGMIECQYTKDNTLAKSFWEKEGYDVIAYQCQKII